LFCAEVACVACAGSGAEEPPPKSPPRLLPSMLPTVEPIATPLLVEVSPSFLSECVLLGGGGGGGGGGWDSGREGGRRTQRCWPSGP
jgi:hypothetical protein